MIDSTDLALVQKAQEGDALSMETLIGKYMWLARSKARKYFLISGGYDDLLQEGLMGIFKAIRCYDYDKNQSLKAFISMCISSQIKDAIRASTRIKHKVLNEAVSLTAFDDDLPPNNPLQKSLPFDHVDPIHNFIEREGEELFYSKLNKLFNAMQLDILKYYLEGYTYSEIAKLVNLTPKKIDNTLHSIKNKIKKNKDMFI